MLLRQCAGLIAQFANLEPYPESVPANRLVQAQGKLLYGRDPLEFVRTASRWRG